jgi:hypothetical protein
LSRVAALARFQASNKAGKATNQELMSELVIPLPEAEPWPTLGPSVCGFIEEYVIHGPGDLRGEPVSLNEPRKIARFEPEKVVRKILFEWGP